MATSDSFDTKRLAVTKREGADGKESAYVAFWQAQGVWLKSKYLAGRNYKQVR
jgi:hypothetical protein